MMLDTRLAVEMPGGALHRRALENVEADPTRNLLRGGVVVVHHHGPLLQLLGALPLALPAADVEVVHAPRARVEVLLPLRRPAERLDLAGRAVDREPLVEHRLEPRLFLLRLQLE